MPEEPEKSITIAKPEIAGRMFRFSDLIAFLLAVTAAVSAYLVADRVFERIPHLEDEMAYVWQARVIAAGDLTIETPELAGDFLIPFVVDHEGRRFGKYPLGWPVVLAFGVFLGVRALVNPILAGLAVWLMYRLGQKLMGDSVGVLAALLTVTSPFFLINGGSLLSHMLGLVLSLTFILAWLDAFWDGHGNWFHSITAGVVLGALAFTRPFTAFGVAFPFLLHGLYLVVRRSNETRKRVIVTGLIAVLLGSLHLLWQWAVTGDPLLNPYELWWEYDKIGFGPGVGVVEPSGHTLRLAWINTKFSLQVAYQDLFGWAAYSYIFLPFGLWASRRSGKTLLIAAVFPTLVVLYLAYWVGAWLYGPRYQFEGLYSLTILTAAGVSWLAGWRTNWKAENQERTRWGKVRALGMAALVGVLIFSNLYFYLPPRFALMKDLYGVKQARIEPFETPEAQALTPAVVIVHPKIWTEYGTLLELEDPYLTTPFVFTFGDAPVDVLQKMFPGRGIYHYYPDEPTKFYTGPRP